MPGSIVVVCTIVTSGFWMSFSTNMYKAESLAECHQYSNDHGGRGMVANVKTFDLNRPDDKKAFEVQCGLEGRQCKNANGKPRAKYNFDTKQWEPIP